MSTPSPPPAYPDNPRQAQTLEALLTELVVHNGGEVLAQRMSKRRFSTKPSIGSSLEVLRKTPWSARRWRACTDQAA